MEVDLESLMNEGQEYIRLRNLNKKTSNPDAGTKAYLVSTDWISKYKKYIFYRNLMDAS